MMATEHIEEFIELIKQRVTLGIVCAREVRSAGSSNEAHGLRGFEAYCAGAEDLHEALTGLGFRRVVIIEAGRELADDLQRYAIDLAWVVSAGSQGRDAVCHAAACLEAMGVAYIGHRPGAASLLDDKVHFKLVLHAFGLLTPDAVVWCPADQSLRSARGQSFGESFHGYEGPFVVKPATGRASPGIRVVESRARLEDVLWHTWNQSHERLLIERALPGREYCVACSGYARWRDGRVVLDEQPHAFALVERLDGENEGPSTRGRARPLNGHEDASVRGRAIALARRIYAGLGLGYLIHLDLRVDEIGALHVLGASPVPDLAGPDGRQAGLVALGAMAEGTDYESLISSLLAAFIHRALLSHPDGNRSLWRAVGSRLRLVYRALGRDF